MTSALKEIDGILTKLYELTKGLTFTNQPGKEEQDVDAYSNLVDLREPLVNRLMEIGKGVDAETASSPEFYRLTQKISAISDLDEEHMKYMEKVRVAVKGSHKDIKTGQKLHQAYTGYTPQSTFDVKQ